MRLAVSGLGVAATFRRESYTAENVPKKLRKLLSEESYKTKAIETKRIVDAENGTDRACDAIEKVLS